MMQFFLQDNLELTAITLSVFITGFNLAFFSRPVRVLQVSAFSLQFLVNSSTNRYKRYQFMSRDPNQRSMAL